MNTKSISQGFGIAAILGITLSIPTALVAPVLTDVNGTTQALKDMGYEPIDVGGGTWFSECPLIRTRFTAKDPAGNIITGYGASDPFEDQTSLHLD